MKKEVIIKTFSDIMSPVDGLCGLVTKEKGSDYLFNKLINIESSPITKVQFDQLLNLQNIGGVSDGFFEFYWCYKPELHFYSIEKEPAILKAGSKLNQIVSIEQLHWGLKRLIIDCLLVFGNVDIGFEFLSHKSDSELRDFFSHYRIDTESIVTRGETLGFCNINKDDRFLISEMACKTLGESTNNIEELTNKLTRCYRNAVSNGVMAPKLKDLLSGKYDSEAEQLSLFEDADEFDTPITDEGEIKEKAEVLAKRFIEARSAAIKNTQLYMSLVNDLDIYVATSMRTKENFISMANFCSAIFNSDELKDYHLRYFDPTISATNSHEDKGLIECLMVKAAKILIYTAGNKDSYGKDAEAAMALSLGKPVIFYCDAEYSRTDFYKNVHPLSRLVNFKTGVAGGAIICNTIEEVIKTIKDILNNTLSYELVQKKDCPGYYLIKEKNTRSVVRVQTNDAYLTDIFWKYYKK